jgi:hypothetical protein
LLFAFAQDAPGGLLHVTPEHGSLLHWPFVHPYWQDWDESE